MGFRISPAPFDPVLRSFRECETAAYDREIRDLQEKIAMLEEARTDYLNSKVEQRELNERDMMIERLR